jgi:hypothetical protein
MLSLCLKPVDRLHGRNSAKQVTLIPTRDVYRLTKHEIGRAECVIDVPIRESCHGGAARALTLAYRFLVDRVLLGIRLGFIAGREDPHLFASSVAMPA